MSKRILYILFLGLFIFGCSRSPKLIPEDELKQIIKELLIAEAVMSYDNSIPSSVADSMDYYYPVLERYGYNQVDVEYTISQMAARQSKPLSNMYEQIQAEMTSVAAKIKYQFNRRVEYNNLAIKALTDTVYAKDTLIKGSTANVKVCVTNPLKGTYTFQFMYQGHRETNIPLRSTKGVLTHRDKRRKNVNKNSMVNRSFSPALLKLDVDVEDSTSYDSLIFTISDPDYSRMSDKNFLAKDSSKTYMFRVVYKPYEKDARNAYFKLITTIDVEKLITIDKTPIYQRILANGKKDSCALGPIF